MDNAEAGSFTQAPFSRTHKKLAAGTFMGMLGDGYTLRIAGVYLVYAQQPLNLSSFQMGLIGAASMFGVFFGSLLTGMVTDRIGRKIPYCLCMFLAVVVALWQYWLFNPLLLVCARFLLGMIVGADYAAGITMLSEWTPSRNREKITGCLVIFWMLGYCLAYAAEFILPAIMPLFGNDGWRVILCTSAIPALITLVIRMGAPESPLWLSAKNRRKEALEIIHQHLGADWLLPPRVMDKPAATSWAALFAPAQWRKTTVSCVFYLAQVVPFFAISIFLPLVLAQMRIEDPAISGELYNIFSLVGVFLGFWLYTSVTRRAFFLWTFYSSAALLSLVILWSAMPPLLALALVTAFALVMAMSLIPEFSYPAELFPTELRASGVGLTVAVSNVGGGIGTFLLPVICEDFGVYYALAFCVGILLLGGVICQMWTPETPGRGKKR